MGGRLANVNDKKCILMAPDVAATVGAQPDEADLGQLTTVCLCLGSSLSFSQLG